MPLLDSLFATGPVPLLLVAATILVLIVAWRRRRPKPSVDAGGPPPDRLARAAARPVTDADRALAHKMITDLVAQVHHGEDMEELRGQEAVVVRLVPQVPIRVHAPPRSWLGGGPAMPADMPWPQVDGRPAMFLAQVCCEDLPTDLWDGLGPRSGWLAFFLDGETFAMRVLHLTACGPLRDGPPPHETVFCPADGLRHTKHPFKGKPAFPRWPVDVVAVRPGSPDPRVESRASPTHAIYAAGYDLAAPEHRPFDWPSTLAMLDLLEERIATRGDVDTPSPLVMQLDKARAMLAGADPSMPADDLTRLRNRVHDLPVLIEATDKARALWQTAIPAVKAIAARARQRAAEVPFSEAEIAPLMAELQALTWMHIKRGTDAARGPGAEDIRCKVLPLTAHDADASLWAHEFETVRFDWAKHAYAAAPDPLPPAVRTYYEGLWPAVAAREMAGIGHVPFKFVHRFDADTEVTLLELPSSDLMSWMFGDVDNLVVTISKADLAAGKLDAVRVQVSN